MLLFIGNPGIAERVNLSFQYITCYSLSSCKTDCGGTFPVSIHHMLLFIGRMNGHEQEESFVSIHHMLLFIRFTCTLNRIRAGFNTSHVTLYPEQPLLPIMKNKFQYITCYSLSWLLCISFNCSLKFQYITCYSLSTYKMPLETFRKGFNTSHVTLYLSSAGVHGARWIPFQYITCYSLSFL